jgi:signal transduction histidine kinase/ActR/RegA family two-component response regulator
MVRSRSLALLLGGIVGLIGLVLLSIIVLRSQERAREDAIDRFAERGELAAQLLAGQNEQSAVRQGADAQVRLSGTASEEALRRWEGEADRGIPYTALFDGKGRLLAAHPGDARPGETLSGEAALAAATKGRISQSGVVPSPDGTVVESYIPFPAHDGLRVLVIGVPTDLLAQLVGGSLEGTTGTTHGTAYLADRSGTLISAVGTAAGNDAITRRVTDAIGEGRTGGTIGDDHLVVSRVPRSGLVIALTAPEEEVAAGLPDLLPPRIALAALAVALVAVLWLATRSVRDARRLHEAREAAERASRMATQANLAKSEFLARMSHELRTPLNAILGFGQVLEMGALTADQRQSTHQIVKGGEHLLELIDEVLDISRIEVGTMRLSLEPVPVEEAIRGAVDLIRPLADERRIDLRVEVGEDMASCHVMADRQRLGQVLLNLLANAVKYNVPRGTVSVTTVRGAEDTVRIGVTDTGPGIPEDQVARLFTPFERLGAEQTGVEGTGLGLALSQSLVVAMGGQLVVDSMMGEGTTFWIQLQETEPPKALGEGPARDEELPTSPGGRILYIEDNMSNLKLIEAILSKRPGIELIPAMTGALGIELARQHEPSIILFDLHLPDLDGEEILAMLRKDPKTRAIPKIVLSADATQDQIDRLLSSGADDYLTKPIDVARFLTLIERILGSSRATSDRPA